MEVFTTFALAAKAKACQPSIYKMAKYLGGIKKYGENTPIPLSLVLKVCGLRDAIWALQITIQPVDKEARLFAADCAEHVLPLFETLYPNDNRPRLAITAARQYANGEITLEQLMVASVDAWAARNTAWDADGDSTWAARGSAEAAWVATWVDDEATAEGVAWVAREAAGDAAEAAEVEWQTERFKYYFC